MTQATSAPMRSFVVDELDARTGNRLVTGAVVPRPIAWVGTVGDDGTPNLAPFSFYNVVSTRPPMVMFSTGLRGGQPKDTLANVRAVPEFTVNMATAAHAEAVNATSAEVGPEVDEFHLAGLDAMAVPGTVAPAVAGCPVVMACAVERFVDLSAGAPDGYVMTIGRVRSFHVAPDLLDDRGRIDQARCDAIARMGGPHYARTTDRFAMERPT